MKKETTEETIEGEKTLEVRTAEIRAHADSIGMHDPSTEAKIAAMETATPRGDMADIIEANFDAQDATREAKAEEMGNVVESRRPQNESLSSEMQKEKDSNEKNG